MGVFDDIRQTQVPTSKPNKTGFMWVTMLIKYDLDGNAEIIRRFVKDAKDSDIKSLYKPKPKQPVPQGPVIERKESTKEVTLF